MKDDSQEFQTVTNQDQQENVIANNVQELFLERTYASICDVLIDDAILDVCFEVHRLLKFGIYDLQGVMDYLVDRELKPLEEELKPSKKESKELLIQCLFCKTPNVKLKKFTTHAAYCTGAKKRNLKDLDSEQDASKKNSSTSIKPSVTSINYQDMTLDELRELFDQKCGVISKRTQKLCMKSRNCPIHTDEQRRDVRHQLLGVPSNEIIDDEEIDVENIVEESILSFQVDNESVHVEPECQLISKVLIIDTYYKHGQLLLTLSFMCM